MRSSLVAPLVAALMDERRWSVAGLAVTTRSVVLTFSLRWLVSVVLVGLDVVNIVSSQATATGKRLRLRQSVFVKMVGTGSFSSGRAGPPRSISFMS